MSKLKRSDVRRVEDLLVGMLDDQRSLLVTMQRELRAQPLVPEVDRLEALLNGVKVALERIGGNVLPSAVQDVHALRAEMASFRHEMIDYHSTLMDLKDFVASLPERKAKPKRAYNRRKSGNTEDHPKVEISPLDAAPHNGMDEEDPAKP